MIHTVNQNLINGVMMGSIYALVALGVSIIYGVMNVVNFANGEFVMLSMYLTFWMGSLWGMDAVATPLITFPLAFLVGILTYYAVIDRTLRQKYVVQIAATVGLATFLQAFAQVVWKAQPRALPYSVIQGRTAVAGYTILYSRLISALVSLVVIIAVYLFLTKTWSGRAMQAAADDLDAASLMGVDFRRTYALTFGLGTALTTIAAGLLMTFQQVDPTMGIRFGLLSWCILALAGLGSIPGLLISGIIVGAGEGLTTALWEPRARSLAVYLIFILVLWLKPRGLFGRKQ
jgi:branched-chain amino acid transport system permease protein